MTHDAEMRSLLTEPHRFMSAGPLVLDTLTHQLDGPAGAVELASGPYSILRELMRRPGVVVETGRLIEAAWPDADLEPENAAHAMRMRVRSARRAMEAVGVSGRMLKLKFQIGYFMQGEPRVIRTFTPAQAAAIDRLLPTLPEFQIAA